MPVSIPQFLAPNQNLISFTPGDNTAWHQIPNFPLGPNPMAAARAYDSRIRSVATGGTADGSAFQVLYNQATTPAAGTVGKLISGSGQTETVPGGSWNAYVKMSTATDSINCEVLF